LLQEIHFLDINPNGEPQLSMSTYTDITYMKTNNNLNLYIGKYHPNGQYQIENHFTYPPKPKELNLSNKELKILKLNSEGFLSKHIAEKLNISFHTVNTHRRNMLKKTGTYTSSKLVKLARDNGMI
jgi:DNA-binding NarL/FixJ family response regulator